MLITVISILAILLVLEKIKSNSLNKKNKKLTESKNYSLEYIDALWESQQSIITEEKMLSIDELLSGLTHKLNTPLGVTLTAASHLNDLIRNDKNSAIIDDAIPALNLVTDNLHKSISLVELFSEISGRRIQEEQTPIKIKEFIDFVCCNKKYNQTKHDINEDFCINISQYTLAIIIQKILNNAYDFALDYKTKTIVTISAESNNSDLIIKIIDNGVGISEKDIKRIYDPFYTTRKNKEHYGLGLAIANNLIIKQYAGTIKCLSVLNKGTTIILTIPNAVCKQHCYTLS